MLTNTGKIINPTGVFGIGRKSHKMSSPVHRDPNRLSSFIFEKKISILFTEQIKITGDANILAAIRHNLIHASFFPPLQGLKPIRGFLGIQRYFSQMRQGDTKSKMIVDVFEDIEGVESIKIESEYPLSTR